MAVLAVTKIRISRRPSSLQLLLMRGNDLITLLAVMAHGRVGHGDAPVLSERLLAPHLKTDAPPRYPRWPCRLPPRPTARAV
jgi:hypothetical protein